MSKRFIAVFAAVLSAVMLFSCGSTHKSSGIDETVALDKIIEAVGRLDTELYMQAFPPDYISAVTEDYSVVGISHSDTIKADMQTTLDVREAAFGDDSYAYYTYVSMQVADIDRLNDDYTDFYTDYSLPLEDISEAYTVTVIITVGGDDGENKSEAYLTFIKIGGSWYLHPKFYPYMV